MTSIEWMGLDGWIDRLSAEGLIGKSVGECLAPVVNRGLSASSEATPVQTGKLKAGWAEDSDEIGNLLAGEGGFYNDVEYAAAVEKRKGMGQVGADNMREAMPEALLAVGKAIGERWR